MRPPTPLVAVALALLGPLAACQDDEQGHLRDSGQRAELLAPVARSDVVQSLRTSVRPGSIIYDAPIDLSYATLRRTRPDLVSQRDARNRGDTARQSPQR